MHPILTNGKMLALYVFGYLPIGAVLVIGFGRADAWGTATLFFLPLTVLFGFLGMTDVDVVDVEGTAFGPQAAERAITSVVAAVGTTGLEQRAA